MFEDMRSLTTLDLSNFDTSKVTDMNSMFEDMRSLTTLDLSNFDTSKVTDMREMFRDMYSLTTLDLSNFDTSNVTDMSSMFYLGDWGISEDKLETIYVNNDFNTTKLTNFSEMFKNREKFYEEGTAPSSPTRLLPMNHGSVSTTPPTDVRAILLENLRLIKNNVVLPFEDIGLGKRP